MTSLTISAYAKVNLLLKVLRKRPDGYHDLHTIFGRISLADTIRLTKISHGIELVTDRPITADPEKNLAHKAAAAFIDAAGLTSGVRITLRKRIPLGAGLGGGSADAAAVLIGMDSLFKAGLGRKRLIGLGRRLGADVAFFVLGATFALGKGRGDRLTALRSRRKLWLILVYPGFEVSTKEVYEAHDLALTTKLADATISLPSKIPATIDAVGAMLHNDLEDTVVGKKMVIGRIVRRLAASSGRRAIVSGSGPSVFCLCVSRTAAERALSKFRRAMIAPERRDWQLFVVGTR